MYQLFSNRTPVRKNTQKKKGSKKAFGFFSSAINFERTKCVSMPAGSEED